MVPPALLWMACFAINWHTAREQRSSHTVRYKLFAVYRPFRMVFSPFDAPMEEEESRLYHRLA